MPPREGDTMKINGHKVIRVASGGYHETKAGWWILNPQTGWVRVEENGRAFRHYVHGA
jgi:UDP-3-O-[3-hydroxymyristoyl] glucosamine N-acyltransferase